MCIRYDNPSLIKLQELPVSSLAAITMKSIN